MKNNTQHYAAPGADETFLHPEINSEWAPREIAVCSKGNKLWMSWIHRKEGLDYPVFTFKTINTNNPLIPLDEDFSCYSKPAFIDNINEEKPGIALFAADEKNTSVRIYEIQSDNQAQCIKSFKTVCSSVYHTDAVCLNNGDIYIVYSGIEKGTKGVSVYFIKRVAGEWVDEEVLRLANHSLNRPKLAVYSDKNVIALADAYAEASYSIFWISLAEPKPLWQKLYSDSAWNMFPSVATDTKGRLWAAWLNGDTVRFEDVAGRKQDAMLACFDGCGWTLFNDHNSVFCADMNLGLLPLKRYFGYDGLRRYPRIVALESGEMLLAWEQQKDEDEIWENISNGFLLGKTIKDGVLSDTLNLADKCCCFTFDNKKVYSLNSFLVAAKSEHHESGNDFIVQQIDISCSAKYSHDKNPTWEHWGKDDFKENTSKSRNVKIKPGRIPMNLYWGDLHCHSVHSPDAEGEIDELYNFSKDIARLDFVAITDNDFYPAKVLLDSETKYIADMAEALSGKDFLGMSGYEWTFHRPDENNSFNHRIVIYPENGRVTARRNEKTGYTEEAFFKYMAASKYFAFPHHGYWKMLADETAVEVTSAWGTCILDAGTVPDALNAGSVFSFIGNSDSHRFMPGLSGALTGVFAEELSHDAIIDAIKQGRCFATTGNRTIPLFYVNDCFMGGRLKLDSHPVISWEITAHNEFESVKIIRDGETVHLSSKSHGKWLDESIHDGRHWYILEVREKGEYKRYPHNVASAWGKYLWTSPIWVN